MTKTFHAFHQQAQERVEQALQSTLTSAETLGSVNEAMLYAVMNGGKRLRPTMVYAAFFSVQKSPNGDFVETEPGLAGTDAVAQALEMIHSYSLVHDDLPAMDDDDLRRGKPSCHKAFDEATAILAGDALQAFAFEQLACSTTLSDRQHRQLNTCLARAAGASGMVGGQMLDIAAVGTASDMSYQDGLVQMETMHRAKTGALICASLEMGAICANASEQLITPLKLYGELVGLAFQVVDDVLDVTASTEQLGKQQGADQLLDKPTYPALMGIERSQEYAASLCQKAKQALQSIDIETTILNQLADYVVQRAY